MADMSAKKRAPGSKKGRKGWAGNRNFIPPWTKLSPEQVFLIRQKQAAGVPTKELATEFQVHRTHINRLVRGARRQNILT